ncbi:MAG: lyase family protein, partial [Acidobacteriota bacterium]|nr:lyase family protein [Acidobacteriota bacterium]
MGESKNLWGGRFTGESDRAFADFNRSFGFDRRLFAADVHASVAHCNSLMSAGVLTGEEAMKINRGLQTILDRGIADAGYFDRVESEDVHSFVEARLVELIGDTGRKLHTGRSRNDQVATDLRLWLREAVDDLVQRLGAAQE